MCLTGDLTLCSKAYPGQQERDVILVSGKLRPEYAYLVPMLITSNLSNSIRICYTERLSTPTPWVVDNIDKASIRTEGAESVANYDDVNLVHWRRLSCQTP